LLKLLDQRAQKKQALGSGDYSLMRDVIAYLHDYPDAVHHPTEDLLFERLSGLRPDLTQEVDVLREQHHKMGQDSAHLLEELDSAAAKPSDASEARIRQRTLAFSRRQARHMQRENRKLFPAAMSELGAADWKVISRRAKLHEDPLFGSNVHTQHRTLFEFLLDFDRLMPARMAASGVDTQERLMMALAAIEHGAGESVSTLLDAMANLKNEARDLSVGERRPESLAGLLATPWRFGWFMGRTTWDCGWTLLGISASSTKKACGAMLARDQDLNPQ
jgi:hemerythrin-like domain-containing protein